MKTIEEIINDLEGVSDGVQTTYTYAEVARGIKQIAELAFDAGYERSEDEWRVSINKESDLPTKEQFIKQLSPDK